VLPEKKKNEKIKRKFYMMVGALKKIIWNGPLTA